MAKTIGYISYASTSTGKTDVLTFDKCYTAVSAVLKNASTLPIDWTIQGSVGGYAWWDLSAATTSTGTVTDHSTVSGTAFDRVRMDIAGNDLSSTSATTGFTWMVGVR